MGITVSALSQSIPEQRLTVFNIYGRELIYNGRGHFETSCARTCAQAEIGSTAFMLNSSLSNPDGLYIFPDYNPDASPNP
jgi:hypothetical protein